MSRPRSRYRGRAWSRPPGWVLSLTSAEGISVAGDVRPHKVTNVTCCVLHSGAMVDLEHLVVELRGEGGDLPGVEVKAAGGGLPDPVVPSWCAFANHPGGGVLILELDEATRFTPVGLGDRRLLKEALASKARRALDPPPALEISDGVVRGVLPGRLCRFFVHPGSPGAIDVPSRAPVVSRCRP